jgi:hypothetical protein
MFLVRLPPSMRETVGAGNHTTAMVMVKAANALWDDRGGHDPTVAAATTQQALLPTGGGEATNGAPPPAPISIHIRTLAMACANFTITMPMGSQVCSTLCLVGKLNLPPNHFRFDGQFSTRHCHGDAFPSQCRTHFSHRRINK